MKISAKGDSACRALIDILTYSQYGAVAARDIARRQNIKEKFLEQVLKTLRKAGIVEGVRGPSGGYLPKIDPAQFTVADLLTITETSLFQIRCNTDACQNDRSKCVFTDIVNKTSDKIYEILSEASFDVLVTNYIELNEIDQVSLEMAE